MINELLLEEYLYAVVPSEMPASYPLEALKAQAVCARTYAYARILHAGLPEYGAHVDDSTAFQVYNNILENAQTTKAVRETKGELLWYGQELADTYYYSPPAAMERTRRSGPAPIRNSFLICRERRSMRQALWMPRETPWMKRRTRRTLLRRIP